MPHKDPEVRRAYLRTYQARPESRERDRARQRGNPRKAAGDRRYVQANAERVSARRHAYYLANSERIRARAQARYDADPRRARLRHDRWMNSVPTRAAAVRTAAAANRRARMYEVQGQIGYENVLELWRREPACVDCGEGRGLDHIYPLSLGGPNISGNLANRCRSCNSRKGRKLPAELAA